MEGTPTAPGAERRGITVGPPVADGWRVVDDHGRALVLPAGAVDATVTGMGAEAHLSILGALAIAGVFFAPWATAAALRISLE